MIELSLLPLLPLLLLLAMGREAATERLPRATEPEAPSSAELQSSEVDVLINNGTIYDGSGSAPFVGDLAIQGDSILAMGDVSPARGRIEIDATGLAVAPGFINMLSWATESLIEDGRSQGDIRQGVTLEIFGEGSSMGPLTDSMKVEMLAEQGDIEYEVTWTTLGEYLDHLVARGVSPNVASFVGATTVREHVLGHDARAPTPEELERMRALVREAMEEGALGVGSSLIYEPAFHASTEELVALAEVAAASGGIYISHIRNEGSELLEAVDELIRIARDARVPAEIYHLKASGRRNWGKLDEVIRKVEAACAAGLAVTADMYTYPASSTGLTAAFPEWVREGGHEAMIDRLRDPAARARVVREMVEGGQAGDVGFHPAGGPQNVLLVGFKSDSLKPLTGRSLADIAEQRGRPAEEVAVDLVVADDSRIQAVYFTMSEENVRREVALPWVSFGSDGGSYATEGVFLRSSTHPRAYGNFARLLGKYVREERVVTLEEAIRRLTSFPAANLGLERRGSLRPGFYADVVVFDPATIKDNATFERPHQYATGVRHIFVNGVQVLREGEHTAAKPGRVVRGRGWRGGTR